MREEALHEREKSSYLTYQAVYRQCFVLQSLVQPCACVWGGGRRGGQFHLSRLFIGTALLQNLR